LEGDLKNGTGAYHKNGKHEQKYWIERVEEAIALLLGDGK
jgi:hypothetical protein